MFRNTKPQDQRNLKGFCEILASMLQARSAFMSQWIPCLDLSMPEADKFARASGIETPGLSSPVPDGSAQLLFRTTKVETIKL
jgi:hypothetical protein